jgi:hypothetical protein
MGHDRVSVDSQQPGSIPDAISVMGHFFYLPGNPGLAGLIRITELERSVASFAFYSLLTALLAGFD